MAKILDVLRKLKPLNPFSYKSLVIKKYKYVINLLLIFLLLSIVLFAILLVPKTLYLKHQVNNNFNSFDNLSINIEADHEERIKVETNPSIVVDLNNATHIEGDLMITKKKLHINMWPLESEYVLKEYSDLKERSESLSSALVFFSLLLLPGILIITILFFIIEAIILALLFSVIGIGVIRAFKRDLKWRKSFKIALLSSVSLMLANAVFIPLFLNFWIPAIIYFIFFCICALSVSFKMGFSGKTKTKKKKSRTNQIFGKSKKGKDKDDFIMLD